MAFLISFQRTNSVRSAFQMESFAQSKINPVLPELGGLFHRRLDAIDRGRIITSKANWIERKQIWKRRVIRSRRWAAPGKLICGSKTRLMQGKRRRRDLQAKNVTQRPMRSHQKWYVWSSTITNPWSSIWRHMYCAVLNSTQQWQLIHKHLGRRSLFKNYVFQISTCGATSIPLMNDSLSQTSCIEFLTAPIPFFVRLATQMERHHRTSSYNQPEMERSSRRSFQISSTPRTTTCRCEKSRGATHHSQKARFGTMRGMDAARRSSSIQARLLRTSCQRMPEKSWLYCSWRKNNFGCRSAPRWMDHIW